MKNFHYKDFAVNHLLQKKIDQKLSISVIIPTLNEEATIGNIVATLRHELMDEVQLLDEIIVVDSNSSDHTKREAEAAGANFYLSQEIKPEVGTHIGKGENMWKSLFVSKGDILCFIDGDIKNFHSGFVSGLVGALLENSELKYVKAHYKRDLENEMVGGRITEILVRPLLAKFYPELVSFHQPLAGEYAMHRHVAESLSFPIGYGVETAQLIDVLMANGINAFAQVDMDARLHNNRSVTELAKASEEILEIILGRIGRDGLAKFSKKLTTRTKEREAKELT